MLTLATDHAFNIGSRHLRGGMPCQDYALSEVIDNDFAYAIVADGCSTGGKTDVGARLLSLATANAIRSFGPLSDEVIGKSVNLRMPTLGFHLELEQRDLLATCCHATLCDAGGYAHVFGDGVVAFSMRNGSLSLMRFDWANNMPAYRAYFADNFQRFIREHGSDLNAPALQRETYDVATDGRVLSTIMPIALSEGIKGYTVRINAEAIPFLDYIAVFSDGVTQVDGIEWTEVVRELLAFKSPAGEFAKRRMNRFLKDADQVGHGPLDDIAYAVIHVDHQPDQAQA